MARMSKTMLIAAAGIIGVSTLPALAQNADFTQSQKDALGPIIKEYLKENPSVVVEALEEYRVQQEQEAMKAAQAGIQDNIAYLTRADAPSVGNPEADVTVVEFFDYNCGYCKRAVPDIQNILKEDKNVRFVFKEMPILGPTSRTAALWALAAHEQGKYFDYHVALMEHRGQKTEEELEKLAKKVGLDAAKMKADIENGEIAKELDKSLEVARSIGVSGTPAFIIGDQFVPGYIGEDGLKNALEEARSAKKDG